MTVHFVFSAYDYMIPASGKVIALTDLQIALPRGCYGRIGKLFFFIIWLFVAFTVYKTVRVCRRLEKSFRFDDTYLLTNLCLNMS